MGVSSTWIHWLTFLNPLRSIETECAAEFRFTSVSRATGRTNSDQVLNPSHQGAELVGPSCCGGSGYFHTGSEGYGCSARRPLTLSQEHTNQNWNFQPDELSASKSCWWRCGGPWSTAWSFLSCTNQFIISHSMVCVPRCVCVCLCMYKGWHQLETSHEKWSYEFLKNERKSCWECQGWCQTRHHKVLL